MRTLVTDGRGYIGSALVRRHLATEAASALEDERPGSPPHVEFDRISETGFDPARTRRDEVRPIAAGRERDGRVAAELAVAGGERR